MILHEILLFDWWVLPMDYFLIINGVVDLTHWETKPPLSIWRWVCIWRENFNLLDHHVRLCSFESWLEVWSNFWKLIFWWSKHNNFMHILKRLSGEKPSLHIGQSRCFLGVSHKQSSQLWKIKRKKVSSPSLAPTPNNGYITTHSNPFLVNPQP